MTETKFSDRLGFVLSAAGSAVGLGNIWRFPYLAAEYGGGIFLLVYIAVTLLFGFPMMSMEIAIGRRAASASISAYSKLDRRGGFIGWLTAAVTLITLPYYCVIGGWVLKYAFVFFSGNGASTGVSGYYSTYVATSAQPVLFQGAFIAVSAAILLFGIRHGIEKANRFLMPALIILALTVAGYTLTLPGALSGAMYYLTPDFSKFSFRTVLAATGQMFYSLSLSSGIMVTFGAYLEKKANIEKSVKQVEIFDIGIAFVSGLIVLCAVFAFSGGSQTALNAGAGLMFETLPRVFAAMPMGGFIGALFFVLVLFAAISSAISMMEVNVANLIELWKITRRKAVLIVAATLFLLGLPSVLGYGLLSGFRPFGMTFLDFADFFGNSVLTPIVAFISCVFIGFVVKPEVLSEEIASDGKFRRKNSFAFMIKWAAPVFILAVLVGAVIE